MKRLITWDWRASIDVLELQDVLKEFGIFVSEVNTYSDEYAIVISESQITPKEADAKYTEWCEVDDDEL